jgi:hypothetical protein
MVSEVTSPVGVNDPDSFLPQTCFGGEKILNLSRTPHGDHGGVLQEKKSVFDLFFSASLGQMVLQTQPIFVLYNSQTESLARTEGMT